MPLRLQNAKVTWQHLVDDLMTVHVCLFFRDLLCKVVVVLHWLGPSCICTSGNRLRDCLQLHSDWANITQRRAGWLTCVLSRICPSVIPFPGCISTPAACGARAMHQLQRQRAQHHAGTRTIRSCLPVHSGCAAVVLRTAIVWLPCRHHGCVHSLRSHLWPRLMEVLKQALNVVVLVDARPACFCKPARMMQSDAPTPIRGRLR